jgi:SAM-dependent methyltransferase
LPFADAVFDRVLFLDVAEHLLPWQLYHALNEIRRVLRPGGYAVIHTLPNRWALQFGYPLLRLVWPGLPHRPRSAYEEQVHVNELSPVDLQRALDAVGLEARVWLEGWTAVHAAWAQGRAFPDPVRSRAYPLLRRWPVRRIAALLLHTPLRLIFANDVFAIAWPRGAPAPPPLWPRAWCERFVTHHASRITHHVSHITHHDY